MTRECQIKCTHIGDGIFRCECSCNEGEYWFVGADEVEDRDAVKTYCEKNCESSCSH